MRHIARTGREPGRDWQDRAECLLEHLRNAPDVAARHDIIDNNSAIWRELKAWLLDLSHGKCWFSEAKDCFSHFEVEHFRPKKSVRDADGSTYGGYWWLTFDWFNFRICGSAGNRKKSVYFPLRDELKRCRPFGDLRQEEVQLLDPADEDDPALLSFDLEGHAIVAPTGVGRLGKEPRRVFRSALEPGFSTTHGQEKGCLGRVLDQDSRIHGRVE